MQFSGIYAITDDRLLPGDRLFCAAEAALRTGIALLQYRSKQQNPQQRENDASQLCSLCKSYSIPLIINDDVDLCQKVGAQGVHLGQSDSKLESAREALGSQAIIGATCHDSISRAKQAAQSGADYVAFGRFFPSNTKPDASPADPEILSSARELIDIPIVAIGGINAENGALLLNAGADMLAVVDSLFGTEEVTEACRKLMSLFPLVDKENT